MTDFIIMVDTTSDVDDCLAKEYGIKLLPAHYSQDGKEFISLPSWGEETRESFYASLKQAPQRYTTAPPSVGEMAKVMEDAVKEGKGVLYLTMSSSLSGTYHFAIQAKELVTAKYPEAEIECFDTFRFGPAIALMAVNAAVKRNGGADMKETVKELYDTKNRYHQAGWLDDLTFVAKKGRITHSKAFFGTLIGVKPIGEFDENGMTTVLGKAKGERSAYKTLINYIKATLPDPHTQTVLIATTNRRPQAEVFCEMIKNEIRPKSVIVKDVYRSSGINVGPGLMAAYYVGTPISKGLEYESKIIKESLEGK